MSVWSNMWVYVLRAIIIYNISNSGDDKILYRDKLLFVLIYFYHYKLLCVITEPTEHFRIACHFIIRTLEIQILN